VALVPEGWLKNTGDVALSYRNDGSICSGVFSPSDLRQRSCRLREAQLVGGMYPAASASLLLKIPLRIHF